MAPIEARSLPTKLAALYVGMTPGAFSRQRQRGYGPKGYIRDGSSSYHYLVAELDRWMTSQAKANPVDPADHPRHQAPQPRRARRRPAAA